MENALSISNLIFWAVIIIGLLRYVKKNQKPPAPHNNQPPRNPNPYQTRPVIGQSSNKSQPIKPSHPNYGQPTPLPSEERPLKRCPHCGAHIPMQMFKCEICGKRLIGCGSPTFLVFIALIVGLIVAVMSEKGMSVAEIFSYIVR